MDHKDSESDSEEGSIEMVEVKIVAPEIESNADRNEILVESSIAQKRQKKAESKLSKDMDRVSSKTGLDSFFEQSWDLIERHESDFMGLSTVQEKAKKRNQITQLRNRLFAKIRGNMDELSMTTFTQRIMAFQMSI